MLCTASSHFVFDLCWRPFYGCAGRLLLVHKETPGTRLSGTKRYKTLALSNAPLVSKLVREGFLSSMYQVRATRISGSLRHPSTGTAQRYMAGATLSRFHKKG